MARTKRARHSELKNTAYEIFIGILSLLSIANLVLVYVFAGDGAMQTVLSAMNALFSVIFLIDFLYRITTSATPWKYFFRGFGWADLLASLPFPQLKILRVFRLLRVYRLLRALGLRTIVRTLVHDRANSTLMTLLLLGILVLQFGSISILAVEEHAEGANITSASDALWYTVVTISTVGYGDQYPVTNLGRSIGVLIIIVGVGIFGTFTGYLANLFLGPSKDGSEDVPDADAPAPAAADAGDDADRSRAASAGVAAGAASGAVATGMSHADAQVTADTAKAASAGVAGAASGAVAASASAKADAAARDARLRALLAQSEQMQAEIRELLADS